VTIYAFPVVAVSSIANRVTGVALSVGCAGLAAAELVGGSGTALSIMTAAGSGGILMTAAAKGAVTFPLTYHYLAGLRHFAWDRTPTMLTNDFAAKSSYYLFGASAALTVVAMAM
jgi:succinate dehydrogenase (ubiquinone) cytochrome b560 subunit